MAEENQGSQKTLVAFVVGLLIGGMLVWAFSGPSADAPVKEKTDESAEEVEMNSDDESDSEVEVDESDEEVVETPVLEMGDGSVDVSDQPAGTSVKLEGATYPISEGWIGVREYNDGNLSWILGAVRFSESNGIVPSEIVLQRSTTAGRDYAIVIFTEDGDGSFNLATDVQIDKVFGTFSAK